MDLKSSVLLLILAVCFLPASANDCECMCLRGHNIHFGLRGVVFFSFLHSILCLTRYLCVKLESFPMVSMGKV